MWPAVQPRPSKTIKQTGTQTVTEPRALRGAFSCRRSERAMQASWLQRAAPPHPIATGMKRASTRAHRPPAAGHDLLQVQSCTEWNIRIGGALSQLEVASQERAVPLSRQDQELCQRLEKRQEPIAAAAAARIRRLAGEVDELWDRLSRVYARMRGETDGDPIRAEIECLRAAVAQLRTEDNRS